MPAWKIFSIPLARGDRAVRPRRELKRDAPEQHKRFLETAHTPECNEDKNEFGERLAKIAKAKSHKEPSVPGAESLTDARPHSEHAAMDR